MNDIEFLIHEVLRFADYVDEAAPVPVATTTRTSNHLRKLAEAAQRQIKDDALQARADAARDEWLEDHRS